MNATKNDELQQTITRQQNQIQALSLALRIAILAIEDLNEHSTLRPDQVELLRGQVKALESLRPKNRPVPM